MTGVACESDCRGRPPVHRHHRIELPFDRGVVEALEWSEYARLCPQPLVSVVMLTYAHEAYLAQAIENVLAQRTEFALELIIGEDCSPDRTLEIAVQYQRKRPDVIRVISGEANVGARWNSYRCERLCRGKYIAYCEGDDYWHDPEKLQKQVEYLDSHPECGLTYTNADTCEVRSGQWTRMAIPYRPELSDCDDPFLGQLTGAMIIWPLTVCLRKDLLDQITCECPEITDETLPMGDTTRFLEIARHGDIHYMPISTATRNLLPESATQSQSIVRKAQLIARCAKVTLHYLDKYPVAERYDRHVRTWVYLRELQYAYLCQDAARARRTLTAMKERGIVVPWRYRFYYCGAVHPTVRTLLDGAFAAVNAAVMVRGMLLSSRTGRLSPDVAKCPKR